MKHHKVELRVIAKNMQAKLFGRKKKVYYAGVTLDALIHIDKGWNIQATIFRFNKSTQ